MSATILLDGNKFQVVLKRLCYQLIETHEDFSNAVILGIPRRGIPLATRIASELNELLSGVCIAHGDLDITFFRDDLRIRQASVPKASHVDFLIEAKNVILIDDVLWTGRTVRAALDAMQALGRPAKVELLVLVDRRSSRQLPIEADYKGIQIESHPSQKVEVMWKESTGEDKVVLMPHDG